MKSFGQMSRFVLVTAFASAPFAVASGHMQPPPRVLLAQAETTTPSAPAQAPTATRWVSAPRTGDCSAAAGRTGSSLHLSRLQPMRLPRRRRRTSKRTAARRSRSSSRPSRFIPMRCLRSCSPPPPILWTSSRRRAGLIGTRLRLSAGISQASIISAGNESVKALARFPEVIRKLNDDVDWTTDLGEAFINQPKDVADAIQDLRDRAEAKGALNTTEEQRVVRPAGGRPQRGHHRTGEPAQNCTCRATIHGRCGGRRLATFSQGHGSRSRTTACSPVWCPRRSIGVPGLWLGLFIRPTGPAIAAGARASAIPTAMCAGDPIQPVSSRIWFPSVRTWPRATTSRPIAGCRT